MRTTADPYSRVYCIRVVPRFDTHLVRIAQYPVDLVMEDTLVSYKPADGIELSDFEVSLGFSPSSFEIKGTFNDNTFTREHLLRGEYDGAMMYLFATSWVTPIENEEPLGRFVFGKIDVEDDAFTIEAVGIIDAYNCDPKVTYKKDCNNTLFDVTPDNQSVPFSVCGLDIADYLVESTVTAVDFGNLKFSDSSRSEVSEWFTYGYVQFKYTNADGDSIYGVPYEVTAFNATTKTFTLLEAPRYNVVIGTEYKVVPGCDKTITTCVGKFDNLLNGGANGGGFFGFNNPPTDRNG